MPIRGIRGAINVTADEPELILQATRELLEEILAENEGMQPEEIASAVVYLASIESAYIVGTELVADGGMSQL